MLNFISADFHKRCPRPHADNYQLVDVRSMAGPQPVGYEFVGLTGGKSVKRTVYKRAAYTGQHHLFHIGQLNSIIINVFAERSKQRRNRIGRRNKHR